VFATIITSESKWDLQYRIADEQNQHTNGYKRKTTNVGQTTFTKQVSPVHLVLVIRIRVVQIVVLFHIFRE